MSGSFASQVEEISEYELSRKMIEYIDALDFAADRNGHELAMIFDNDLNKLHKKVAKIGKEKGQWIESIHIVTDDVAVLVVNDMQKYLA